jgi:leucyl aminopeptidase
MPVESDYADELKSPVADMRNTGSRYGGAITAALFLQNFVKEGVEWAHVDIAGGRYSLAKACMWITLILVALL